MLAPDPRHGVIVGSVHHKRQVIDAHGHVESGHLCVALSTQVSCHIVYLTLSLHEVHGNIRKLIIAPDGGDAWAPAKPRPDVTLIRALTRAHRWKRMLEAGKCRSITEIAEAEKIGRSFVSRLLRLTLLAPDIQEAIMEGRQAKGIQLDELMGAMPGEWGEQRRVLQAASSASSAR